MATYREDPYGDYSFQVTIEGVTEDGAQVRGGFTAVTGLEATIDVIEYRNGNEVGATVRKIPGLAKFSNIKLKRGVIGDLSIWNWFESALDGNVQRADGTIVLLDESRQPVMSWRFRRGWPCRWKGPKLRAQRNEVALETLEICHEGLEIVS